MPVRIVIASETGDLKATLRELAGNDVALLVEDSKYVSTFAYNSTATDNVEFIGEAAPGSSKASAAWRIRKLTYNTDNNIIDIQFADGDVKFNNIWDDRESLAYS